MYLKVQSLYKVLMSVKDVSYSHQSSIYLINKNSNIVKCYYKLK